MKFLQEATSNQPQQNLAITVVTKINLSNSWTLQFNNNIIQKTKDLHQFLKKVLNLKADHALKSMLLPGKTSFLGVMITIIGKIYVM